MKIGGITLTRGAIVVIVVLIVCLLLALWYTVRLVEERRAEADNAAKQALLGDTGAGAPIYTGINGEDVNMEDLLGTMLVVNSWASWSPLSQQELQDLNAIAGEYKDKNIRFIALNRKETKEQAMRLIETLPELSNLTFVIDAGDYFYNNVGGYAMPETMLYNERGELISHERTVQTQESMRTLIEQALQLEKN